MAAYPPTGKVELLAPAGNMEKLEIVLHYGADAVYLSGPAFGLRHFAGNFTDEELGHALALARTYRAKLYVTVNVFPRDKELKAIETHLRRLDHMGVDAIIVADPAVIALARRVIPRMPIHLSTQANTTNSGSVEFWRVCGVSRINAARELTLAEIGYIADKCPTMEIETFVHGAMCISYSGRCLLSSFMAQRSANQGKCCQPCRFKYALVEETRPGQYYPICEDEAGTYVFNSRDLCMIAHLPELMAAGVRAFKIEGRMKSIHYAATVVKTYREAIDLYYADPQSYQPKRYWQKDLDKVTNRGYCNGLYFGDSGPEFNAPRASSHPLAAKILSPSGETAVLVEVRNQLRTGDAVEIIKTTGPPHRDHIIRILDRDGGVTRLAQPGSRVTLQLSHPCEPLDLIRLRPNAGTVPPMLHKKDD
ncbi:MAG: U32 family peptidase [Desulfatitalea sp.]|nr:U32 family peptidase [Desulfatitalea sp.]NNK02545.1 U32 family peptidase [Desulfatitalea sp.]